MTDHAHEVFCLEQLLAVLERRLTYAQMDYDAVLPALAGAIEVAEDSLSPEDEERLAGFRKTHAHLFKKRAEPPSGPLEVNPNLKVPPGEVHVVQDGKTIGKITDLCTHQDIVIQELQQFLSNLDRVLSHSCIPNSEVRALGDSSTRFSEAFEKFVRTSR
jgi:hypothetical protein